MAIEQAILVTGQTRLEQLIERFNSRAQARFYIESTGGSFADYESEYDHFYASLEVVQKKVSALIKLKQLDRKFLPNFMFPDKSVVLVLGQDGLVANTAKYVAGRPIVAINPDTERYDGQLLPFTTANADKAVLQVLQEKYRFKQVTMAEAQLNDGQRLLAFNDLFIGPASHSSARYLLEKDGIRENQSSSGIIVSTGAGSTGWLSSIFNMANGLNRVFGNQTWTAEPIPWDADQLTFVVREPFRSRTTQIELAAGLIGQGESLHIESGMPTGGVIFSDGIQTDFLQFNAGTIANIGIAPEHAKLVC